MNKSVKTQRIHAIFGVLLTAVIATMVIAIASTTKQHKVSINTAQSPTATIDLSTVGEDGPIETAEEALLRSSRVLPRGASAIDYRSRLISREVYDSFEGAVYNSTVSYSTHTPTWLIGLVTEGMTMRGAATSLTDFLGITGLPTGTHVPATTNPAVLTTPVAPNISATATMAVGGSAVVMYGVYYAWDANSGELIGAGTLYDSVNVTNVHQKTMQSIEALPEMFIPVVTASPIPTDLPRPTPLPEHRG